MKRTLISFLGLSLVAGIGVAQSAFAGPSPHPPRPRITMAEARTMALRHAPGRIISSEYEKEGSGWRYSFDIQQKGNVQEIGIDGQTGRIVENKSEGVHDRD